MKYYICGAGGFIGGHTSKRLLNEGHEVTYVDATHHFFNSYFLINIENKKQVSINQMINMITEYPDNINMPVGVRSRSSNNEKN